MSCYSSLEILSPSLWSFTLHMCSFIFSKRIKELLMQISGVFLFSFWYSVLQTPASHPSLHFSLKCDPCLSTQVPLDAWLPPSCALGQNVPPDRKLGKLQGSPHLFVIPSQGSRFCAICSRVSEDSTGEGQVWSHLFLHLIYLKF